METRGVLTLVSRSTGTHLQTSFGAQEFTYRPVSEHRNTLTSQFRCTGTHLQASFGAQEHTYKQVSEHRNTLTGQFRSTGTHSQASFGAQEHTYKPRSKPTNTFTTRTSQPRNTYRAGPLPGAFTTTLKKPHTHVFCTGFVVFRKWF